VDNSVHILKITVANRQEINAAVKLHNIYTTLLFKIFNININSLQFKCGLSEGIKGSFQEFSAAF
jgi:hypothetical protein